MHDFGLYGNPRSSGNVCGRCVIIQLNIQYIVDNGTLVNEKMSSGTACQKGCWPLFYRVSDVAGSIETLTHIHTFKSTSTENLLPVLGLWGEGSSVPLCGLTLTLTRTRPRAWVCACVSIPLKGWRHQGKEELLPGEAQSWKTVSKMSKQSLVDSCSLA